MKKLVLIDGHSILNRAFFGVPDLTNSEGLHTNAVYGFLNILFKILEEEQPDYLTVAFDRSEPTFRHEMFADYKGTRKPMAEELRQQIPVMKDVLHAMGIVTVEKAGYEADDLLGTLAFCAESEGLSVSIVSGDRDLLQLATDKIKIRIPKTKKTGTEIEDYYAADVKARYQVTPTEFIDVKALMGDSSDNIPGVPGIGEKGATAIIAAYHNIENAYAHVEDIKPNRAKNALAEHYDLAVMSKQLATIDVHADISYDREAAAVQNFYTPEAYVWMKRLEFKQMLQRFEVQNDVKEEEQVHLVISDVEEATAYLSDKSNARLGIAIIEDKEACYGAAIAVENEEAVIFLPVLQSGEEVVPLAALLGDNSTAAKKGLTNQELRGLLQTLCQSAPAIATFDLKKLLKYVSIEETKEAFDAGLAAYLLHPLKNTYAYDDIAKDYLNKMIPGEADLLGKLKLKKAVEENHDAIVKLACLEAKTVLESREPLLCALQQNGMEQLYQDVELPLVYVLFDMEQAGVCVDGAALIAYGRELSARIAELEQSIYAQAGETFNINSPKQLGVILFEKLQMKGGKKTKTGYSTAADVLEKLAQDHPIVSDILEYRQLTKLKSTYADGLQTCIAPDGRIHTTFNQTVTATGRLSSTEPNLQNIPIRMEMGRLIRKVFIPKEGYAFVDADYSQIELRVLAHMSEDENLIAAYSHAQDIHRITASQVFHTPLEEVTPLQRRNAKAVNFGIVYGISSFGLSQDLSISRKEAESYIQSYFATFPGIKAFLDRTVSDAKETGCAVTLFGRRRQVPELSSGNFMQRQFGERIAMNSPIQGTAADIIKIAMIRVYRRLKAEGLCTRLILQVHDELLVEAPIAEIEQVKHILSEEMRGAASLAVELEIDLQVGSNWLEAH